jgi:hypothetical protein
VERLVCPFSEGARYASPLAFPVLLELLFWPTLMGVAPGVSSSSCVKLRPFNGRSFTSVVDMMVPSSEVVDSTCAPSASTVTLDLVSPTFSPASIFTVWSTPRRQRCARAARAGESSW